MYYIILLLLPAIIYTLGPIEDKEFMRTAMFENDPQMAVYRKLPSWLKPDHLIIRKKVDLSQSKFIQLDEARLNFENAVLIDSYGQVRKFSVQAIEYGAQDYSFTGLDFSFDQENGSGIYQSGGLFDINVVSEEGKKLDLMEGSYIELSYPVDKNLNLQDMKKMKVYSYDEKNQRWIFESSPKIIKKKGQQYFSIKITHFSFWNIDAPITEHTCVEGRLQIEGTASPRIVTIVAEGLDYRGTTQVTATNGLDFKLDVKRDSKVSILAYTSHKDGYYIPSYQTSKKMSSSKTAYLETYTEIRNSLDLLGCETNISVYTNIWGPSGIDSERTYGTGGYVLQILSNRAEPYKYERKTYTNQIYWLITTAPSLNNTWVTNFHEQYLYSDLLLPLLGREMHNEESENYLSDLKQGKWIGYYYLLVDIESRRLKMNQECSSLGILKLDKQGYKMLSDVYKEKKLK